MKPILFIDYAGTLCFNKFWRSVSPEIQEKIQKLLFNENKKMVNDWMIGKYTSEQINQYVADSINIPYETIWELFVQDCKTMTIDSVVLDRINTLRKTYTTVLMTDNMDCFDRFTVPALDLQNYFDLIVNSYTKKTSKNDNNGKLFSDVCAQYSIPVSLCTLIDNSKNTCDIFSSLGGKSLFVTSENTLLKYLKMI